MATTIAPGDLVVHAEHGIGRLEGLASLTGDDRTDAFAVTFRGGGRVLVPIHRADLLTRYGPGRPKLDRLDSPK